ncbi:hypothetical protein REPUB_Repub18cG0061100 [Reevesia pubescens]
MDPFVVAKAFVEHYYSTFDAIQACLANLFQQCQHNITTVDCQPFGAGGILVFIFGALQLAGEQHAIKFSKKEKEFKILEHSVEELECTINVLEKKVYELDEELERHRLIRSSLELELQALTDRLSKVDNFDVVHSVSSNAKQTESLISRQMHNKLLELHEAHDQIRILEKEKAELTVEIKQCKDYISVLVLHSEAQASQYRQKGIELSDPGTAVFRCGYVTGEHLCAN